MRVAARPALAWPCRGNGSGPTAVRISATVTTARHAYRGHDCQRVLRSVSICLRVPSGRVPHVPGRTPPEGDGTNRARVTKHGLLVWDMTTPLRHDQKRRRACIRAATRRVVQAERSVPAENYECTLHLGAGPPLRITPCRRVGRCGIADEIASPRPNRSAKEPRACSTDVAERLSPSACRRAPVAKSPS